METDDKAANAKPRRRSDVRQPLLTHHAVSPTRSALALILCMALREIQDAVDCDITLDEIIKQKLPIRKRIHLVYF